MSEYIIEWSGIGRQLAELSYTKPQIVWPKYIRKERLREEIVRCRDCKHYREHEWMIATDVSDVCFFFADGVKVAPDCFCAWGERNG